MPVKSMYKKTPHQPGDLIRAHQAKMHKHHKGHAHHKMSPLTGLREGSPADMRADKHLAHTLGTHSMHKHAPAHHKMHHMVKHAHHMAKHMKKMAAHMHKMAKHHKAFEGMDTHTAMLHKAHATHVHHMMKAAHHLHKAMKAHHKAKLGTGARFRALTHTLASKGAKNPKALAAYIGRRKLGNARMSKLAAAGRRRHARA